MLQLLRKYPVSVTISTIIWVICLIPIGETPLSDVNLIDKWAHIVMYFSLSAIIMTEYAHRHRQINIWRLLVAAIVLPIIMGGLIELAQAYLTGGNRSGEWLDWAADSVGSLLAAIIGIPLVCYLAKARKDN